MQARFDEQTEQYLKVYNEGIGTSALSTGLAGVLALSPTDAEARSSNKGYIPNKKINTMINDPITNYIADHEGFRTKVYRDSKGYKTIGIGHLITNEDASLFKTLFGDINFNSILEGFQELTPEQVITLFKYDLRSKERTALRLFPNYNTYSMDVKCAILDGIFRGDLSNNPKTIKLINSKQWKKAAKEYLNNSEYRLAKQKGSGVAKRMEQNAYKFFSVKT